MEKDIFETPEEKHIFNAGVFLENNKESIPKNKIELEKGKEKISTLITFIRNSDEYKSAIENRIKQGKEKNPAIAENEVIYSFEGLGDKNSEFSGVQEFKNVFWNAVDKKRFIANLVKFDKKHFSPEITNQYQKYVLSLKTVLNNISSLRNPTTIQKIDKAKSDIHDELASQLLKEGLVPSHLWGRLTARLWLYADGMDEISSARIMDELRIARDTANIAGVDSRKIFKR